MAVRIRLTRHGRKKQPFYRIVAANSEAPRDGKFLEIVGTYDPMQDPVAVVIHQDKLQAWIDKGALMSDTVKSLLTKQSESPVTE